MIVKKNSVESESDAMLLVGLFQKVLEDDLVWFRLLISWFGHFWYGFWVVNNCKDNVAEGMGEFGGDEFVDQL